MLILGIEYQGLGVLRQAHAAGIATALVDEEAWGPARFSRYRGRRHQSPKYSSDEFWPWLEQLAEQEGYRGWVLVPTHDDQVLQFAKHYDAVQRVYRYAGPPWESARHFFDKRDAVTWADGIGLPQAKSFVPKPGAEWPAPGYFTGPFVVKPAVKRAFQRHSNKKAIQVGSVGELKRRLAEEFSHVPVEELLYQELIPGGGENQWSYAGFFVDGEPVAAFTACRLRQHPPDFGRASTCVVAQHDEEVERLSRKALAALKYTGLAEVEWKRDARDGSLKFLEVNARCWGWHSLASRVVGNLPEKLYRYLVDGEQQRSEAVYGAVWTKWITDLPVVVHLMVSGKLSPRAYMQSLRGGLVSCDWDRNDAAPFFMQFGLLPYLVWKRGY